MLKYAFFKTKNSFVSKPFPPDALNVIERYLTQMDYTDTFSLDSMGGAVRRKTPTDTAFVHRDVTEWLLINSHWRDENVGPRKIAIITSLYNEIQPYLTPQVYENAPDLALVDPLRSYYGENLSRLRQVKRIYDPENVFNYSQSVPV